jgi:hypothetical protein
MEDKAFDIIPKMIAILTSLLVFLGIISSVVYYRSFGINILDYITIGESLLLFISKFMSFSISVVFGVILSRLFLEFPKEQVQNQDNKIYQNLSLNFWQQIYLFFIILPLFLLSVMGFSPFALWVLPVSFLVRIYVLSYIIKRLRIVFHFKKIDKKYVDYIQTAGISIIILVSIAMTEAYLVYEGHKNKVVTLYYSKGNTLQTDSNILYLGKSQLYYYLYDKCDKKAIVIKDDQIERLEIK